MRQVVICLIIAMGMWTAVAATQDKQSPAEQRKNAVDVAVEESQKRGEKVVVGSCLQDCDKSQTIEGKITADILELPKPAYPPIARAARVSGVVTVMVLIDFDGTVSAAAAIDGHPLLRAISVDAARGARFSPVLLDGEPVKVSGVIRYNFATQ